MKQTKSCFNPMPYVKTNKSEPWYWEMRDNAETRKLSQGDYQLAKNACYAHNARHFGKSPVIKTSADMRRVNLDVVRNFLTDTILTYYRVPSGKWAGGKAKIIITAGLPHASSITQRVRSDNNKWTGNNVVLYVNVMPSWRTHVLAEGIGLVDGLLTTHAVKIGENLWQASWLVQGRGFELNIKNGVICKFTDSDGVTCLFHASNVKTIQHLIVARSKQLKIKNLANNMYVYWLHCYRSADSAWAFSTLFGTVCVTKADSKLAGNCVTGTNDWLRQYFPTYTKDGIPVKELIESDGYNTYAWKAICYAVARHCVRKNINVTIVGGELCVN